MKKDRLSKQLGLKVVLQAMFFPSRRGQKMPGLKSIPLSTLFSSLRECNRISSYVHFGNMQK
jgi:hypothetical protein